MKRLPFEGVNVLDLTWAGVGPGSISYLGNYGATIVKMESHRRPDCLRALGPFKDGIPHVERSYYFAYAQTVKRYDITLNMDHPKGKEVFEKFVRWADIVADSFAGGTMEKWGMDYDNLVKIKPDIIMLRTCMHGHTGPLAKQHGQGFILTALSGIDAIISWPDRPPAGLYGAFTDHIAPLFNAVSLVAALDYRRRTGKGVYIDQSQHESVIHWIIPLLLDYAVNNREAKVNGNSLDYAAPHGIYRCQGEDSWCAIAVSSDKEWKNFCEVIESPMLADDPKYTTLLSRKKNESELNNIVEAWTTRHTPEEVMELMQKAGVAAGKVNNSKDQAEDPQLEHYEFFHHQDHPEIGDIPITHGPLFNLSKTPYELGRPRLMGEDNEYVYTKLLGYSDEEFVQLMTEEIV